jgi:predicted Fe-Mo cluster-binding NifX family protein
LPHVLCTRDSLHELIKANAVRLQRQVHFEAGLNRQEKAYESKNVEEINNSDLHHAHGMCQPLKALGARQVDAVAVGGIGVGALMKLQAQGIRVFRVTQGTVGQNVQFILKNNLPQFDARFTCAGHTGGGCAH